MNPERLIFDLRVSTLPMMNVRMEFKRNRKILSDQEFRAQVVQWRVGDPLNAQYVVWGGEPSVLLTWFLQRSIIGLEAYIPSAVFMAAMHYRRLSADVIKGVKDPFSLRCTSSANTFYNCLPGLVDTDFRMIRARGSVWKKMRRFYDEVRNPLFHGSQLYADGHSQGETLDSVLKAFDLFLDVYNWVDWWFPPRLLDVTGAIPISEPPRLANP